MIDLVRTVLVVKADLVVGFLQVFWEVRSAD